MTKVRPIQTAFNAGEISPRMCGRVDTAVYPQAVETLENFVPTVEGPIVKRPGFEYITPAAATAAWLTNFRFDITQDYLIEWSEGKLRFFTNGARIETAPGVPYEVTVPYTAAEAPFVSCQQSYDRLYLDHPNHPPARLTRTSATTFVYDVPDFTNGPFADTNSDTSLTVIASAVTGSVTLTASSGIFQAGHVGGLFRIEAADFASIQAWQVGIDGINSGAIRRYAGQVYTAVGGSGVAPWRTGTNAPTHSEGTAWDGSDGNDINTKGPYGVQWAYRHDRFGILKITAVADAQHATATVLRRLPDSLTSITSSRWAHGLFSNAAGWPSIVTRSFGRLCHFKLFDVCASVVGDFWNHQTFTTSGLTAADLAFRRTLDGENPPLWAIGDRKLLVGTATGELAIGPQNANLAVSGDNIAADPQSFYGVEPVKPLQAAVSTFFVQRGGRKIREAQYQFGPDRYVAANCTVWARHITKGGILQLAFQKDPEELLLALRTDGQIIVHPHQPEQDVKGFARIIHSAGAGEILSIATIASQDGESDELWALVLRDGQKSIERMAEWRDDDDPLEEAFFVDAGARGTSPANKTHYTGLTHLANKAVVALIDGGAVDGLTVAADGTLDIPAGFVPNKTHNYAIGLSYTARCVTLRPEIKLNGETQQGKRQRLVRIVLRLLGSVGIQVGAKGGKLDNLIDRPGNSNMDQAIQPFTGDSERAVSGGYDTQGQSEIVSVTPTPCTIVCAMPQIQMEPAGG